MLRTKTNSLQTLDEGALRVARKINCAFLVTNYPKILLPNT